jgi:hypothetical protein
MAAAMIPVMRDAIDHMESLLPANYATQQVKDDEKKGAHPVRTGNVVPLHR